MSGISGFHHISMISSDPEHVLKFYVETLGLRLLRRTVNLDQHSVLQFYCGDDGGSPGSIISFLFQTAERGRLGTGQVTNITFTVAAGTHDYWFDRLVQHDVDVEGYGFAFGERQLLFRDPDGLPLALIERPEVLDSQAVQPLPSGGTSDIAPVVGRIRSIEIQLTGFEHMARFMQDFLGFERGQQEKGACRFFKGTGPNLTIVDLVSAPTHEVGTRGPGATHHVAWRVPDIAALDSLCARLAADGFDVTPPLDREYFRAAYFLAPGAVMFALATDGPGFPRLDVSPGSPMPLSLPPWLEDRRKRIEKTLRHWNDVSKLN